MRRYCISRPPFCSSVLLCPLKFRQPPATRRRQSHQGPRSNQLSKKLSPLNCPTNVTSCNDSSCRSRFLFPAVFSSHPTTTASRSSSPSSSNVVISFATSSGSQRSQPLRQQPRQECKKVQSEGYSATIYQQQQHHATLSYQITLSKH